MTPDDPGRRVTPFSGVVLTGGRSSRMGTDKAFVAVGGLAMVERVATVLHEAGATEVVAVGGDLDGLRALGLHAVADRWPGEGPLGGLLTGAGACVEPLIVVSACDLPGLDAPTVLALVAEMHRDPPPAAALPVVDGYRQMHLLCVARSALGSIETAFHSGERSIKRAFEPLTVSEVAASPEALLDVDTPDDLGPPHLSDRRTGRSAPKGQ